MNWDDLSSMQPQSLRLPPHIITNYVCLIVLLCVFISSSCVLVQAMAGVTKAFIHNMVVMLSRPNGTKQAKEHIIEQLPPLSIAIYQLIDRTCPITSHTPSRLPSNRGARNSILPETLSSPCGGCDDGIEMGQLGRTLPCGHIFHGRCVDRLCLDIKENIIKDLATVPLFQCPLCQHVVFPTPDLVEDCVIQTSDLE